MGYITNQAEYERAITFVTNQARTLDAARQGGLGLNDEGLKELLKRGVAYIDGHREMNVTILVAILDQLKAEQPLLRDDFPHANDSSLDWIKSIADYKEASAERIKFYLRSESNSDRTKDASGKTLYQRFQERLAWLQINKIHRVKNDQPAEPVAAAPLTPEQQAQADARKRLDAVYAKIDKSGGHDWQQRTIQFRLWLKNKVAELLKEKRGIAFIEKHIDEAIRTQENGSIR